MKNFTRLRFCIQGLLAFLLLFTTAGRLNAQVVTVIGTGTQAPLTNGAIYSPICKFSGTGNPYSTSNMLYTASELNNAGITSGASITKLAFYKIGSGSSTAPFKLSIYATNSSTAAPLSTATTRASIITNFTQVYTSTSHVITSATGWQEFPLTIPIVYTGQNLEIAFDSETPAGSSGTYDWQYTPGFADYIIGYVSSSAATTLNGTVTNYKQRANIQISYIPGTPCSGTPVPGDATVTPAVTCANTPVMLNLINNTPEANQTYTWQSATAIGGPYTDISTPSASINLAITATATRYYRAMVSCSSGPGVASTPVLLTVNPAFPAGTYTIDNSQATAGTNFNTFTEAFNALSCGVAGKVIFNVSAGQTFNENPPELNATSIVSDSIIFQKSGTGPNPVIRPVTAGTIASSTTLASNGDAVIVINGGDYITFDGIDINTDNFTTGVDRFEYGYYLKKKSATDACKGVTIKNAQITLAQGTIFSFGIFVSNNSALSTAITVSSTGGRSENIKLYGNTISNSYGGILVRGYSASSPYDLYDQGLEIGVGGSNTINSFGGGATATYGMYIYAQNNFKIGNNTIDNNNGGQTTTLYGIYTTTCTNASAEIYNNTVTLNGYANTLYNIYNDAGGTGTNNTIKIYNNTVTGAQGTGTIYGIYQNTTPFVTEIYNNNISNNSIASGTGSFYGIYGTGAVVSSSKIYNNVVENNTKTGSSGTINGIYSSAAATTATTAIYNNAIRGLTNTSTSTGSVFGLVLAGGGPAINVYNNFISDLNAPTSSNTGTTTTDLVRGISISSTTTASALNLSFNTIYLNASSSGANFSAAAIFHTGSATATTAALTLKNNIIINMSTAAGTGYVTGLRRSLASLANFTAAGNNDYYINGGSNHNVYYDGTNAYADLTAYKSAVAKEEASVFENPPFINSGSAPYDLHIASGTPTQVESGGITVPGITTDFDGNTRNVSTPDIGADEFTGIAADLTGPAIIYTALPVKSICIDGKTITATITDASGINTTAGTKPRLWFKKATENDVLPATNTSASNGWKYVEASNAASPFVFNFNFNLLASPLVNGDSVSYFIVAQDNVSTPNIGVNAAVFNAPPASVSLSAAAFPTSGSIKGFSILSLPNPIVIQSSVAELCQSGTVTLNIDGGDVTGGEYQWQSSPTGANTWTDIALATTIPYTTASITQSTDFRLVVKCGGTPIASSPSNIKSVTVNVPVVTATTAGMNCGPGSVNLQATGSAGTTLNWYAAATGGASIGTGSPFATPSISTTTTYYVAASTGGGSASLGPVSPAIGTGSGSNLTHYLIFSVTNATTIQSVDIFPTAAVGSSGTIEITNSSGTVLYTVPYTTTVTGTTTPQTIPINYAIAPGTNYRMRQGTAINLFRNDAGAVHPYANADISITGNSFSAAYYYYFYNWQISSSCSSTRTAVVATIDNTPGCTMPVTLLNFTGEKRGNYNKLLWSTATEINNSGFELQRSTDGVNFSKVIFVNSKAANGNSSSVLTYSFDDITPLKGYNYYRLKQVDKDGRSTLTNIVLIKGDKITDVHMLAVYPNPVKDKLNVKVEAPASRKATIVVTDAMGKVILQQPAQLTAGENRLEVFTSMLAQGTYFIKLTCIDGCNTTIHKFIKQ